jgi:hypothetical protein
METFEDDPVYWRRRGDEAREQAETIADPELRFLIKNVALGYDLIAEKIEQQIKNRRRCGCGDRAD